MTSPENDFVLAEMARRTGGVDSSSSEDFEFLRGVNDVLGSSGLESYPDQAGCPPMVWVIGLPRSGTTILMQLLCACLNFGYVTNVAARFWRAPISAIRLSRILLGDRRDRTWQSSFGKSVVPEGPHEYSYFWHWLLKMESMPPYDAAAARKLIDWDFVRRVLMNMNLEFGRPVAHKAMAPSYHLQQFADLIPNAVFVHITRDPIDIAASLANARLSYYGDYSSWWSLYTDDYTKLRQQPYWRQIARQIAYIRELQTPVLEQLDSERVCRISYANLCADPAAAVARVAECLRNWSGTAVAKIGAPPLMLQATAPMIERKIYAQLCRGLEELGIPERDS